ncbi:MAG: hypothetical protein BKP49_09560 [Treponema sp. CETP13]|nr:MAG: hypothetical protein BKP49_09560 [Treponema sp. CETP13]
MKIKSSSLKVGQKFSEPLFFEDGKNMFLAQDCAVRKSHLEVISRWDISFLITEGHVLKENEIIPNLDEIEEVEELESLDEVDGYFSVIEEISDVFENKNTNQTVDRKTIDSAANKIIQNVGDDKISALHFVISESPQFDSYVVSAVNVAITSCVMGIELQFPQKALQALVIAALLHDIGMKYVSEKIVKKKGKLTSEEFEQLKMHTFKSAKFASDNLLYSREVASIINQHHERWDGTGYPEGRKGSEIATTARILSVADAFDAMISTKSYRNSMIAYEAVKNLLRDKGKRFDPTVLKLFIKCIGVYPVGSYVLLNDDSIALVSASVLNSPFMPNVKIIKTPASKKNFLHQIVKLSEQNDLFIVRALRPEEVVNEKK